jgi:outer membrane lipase/esterase
MHLFKFVASALGAALLVACGGGGNGDQSPKVAFTSVKVMGDSLSDSGAFDRLSDASTYGRIFSVQGSDHKIWTERVASAYGLNSLCNFYQATGTDSPTGFEANSTAGCTNYAIGGARINNAQQPGGNASPMAVATQLATALAVSGGTFSARDLLLVDGGGNDAADLATAYLGASSDGGAAFAILLNTLSVTPPASAAEFPAKGVEYMTALANTFYDSVKSNALDHGATHVVIVNLPGITNTPRFQAVLDAVSSATSAAYGGGSNGAAAGATARAQTDTLIRTWVAAFNSRLKARAAGNGAVLIVDLNTEMDNQIANPAQYGLTNVTTPACPATGSGVNASYNFATCTATALSAMTPPVGAVGGADWWKTYAFSDGFHPTPYGYKLLAQLVTKELVLAGWL